MGIQASDTDYVLVGPFAAGEIITELRVILSSAGDNAQTLAPALVRNSAVTANNHATGTSLILRSDARINGINATIVYQAANIPSTISIPLDQGPLNEPTWILIAVTNADGLNDLQVLAWASSTRPAARPIALPGTAGLSAVRPKSSSCGCGR